MILSARYFSEHASVLQFRQSFVYLLFDVISTVIVLFLIMEKWLECCRWYLINLLSINSTF